MSSLTLLFFLCVSSCFFFFHHHHRHCYHHRHHRPLLSRHLKGTILPVSAFLVPSLKPVHITFVIMIDLISGVCGENGFTPFKPCPSAPIPPATSNHLVLSTPPLTHFPFLLSFLSHLYTLLFIIFFFYTIFLTNPCPLPCFISVPSLHLLLKSFFSDLILHFFLPNTLVTLKYLTLIPVLQLRLLKPSLSTILTHPFLFNLPLPLHFTLTPHTSFSLPFLPFSHQI